MPIGRLRRNIMSKTDFHPQLIVKNKETGGVGVTCDDLPGLLNCNGPDEISVVYDGTIIASGTDYRVLEIIGQENAIADLHKCGAGKGEECCIFLTFDPNGIKCQRFGDLRWSLVFLKMNSKRCPKEPFPRCQIP